MDPPSADELAHNDVPDVSTSRLTDLERGDPALAASIERLIASVNRPLETSLGWNSFLDPSRPFASLEETSTR
jgi:FXSXX-COOH protein